MFSIGDKKSKIFVGNIPAKHIYCGDEKQYSSGSTVTYYVDSNVHYTEEVDSEATCLSPKTFTPTKSGWTFVGWREDTTASNDVLPSKVMGDTPITLYAVFSLGVTLTYYNDNTTASTHTGTRYYNNGNIVNPSFTMTQSTKSGWTALGWSTSNAANATINYNNGDSITISSNTTIYGCYSKTTTVTYYDNSTTAKTTTGTSYYNSSGNISNPSFTLTQASRSGWSARGWSTGTTGNAGVTYKNATAFNLTADITLYGMYEQTITVTYYNNSTTKSTANGTRYYNSNGNIVDPTFTIAQASKSGWTARGWSTSNAGNAGITYASISNRTISENITLYGLYQQTITVTYYNNSTSASSTTGTRYWAPAGYINPSFTLTQASKSGWSARGWSTGTAGNSAVTYNNATAFTRDSNVTLYGLYQLTCTLTCKSYNSTQTVNGTAYYNSSGNTTNASVTAPTGASMSGWTWRGWSSGGVTTGNASVAFANGGTVNLGTSNHTIYGLYQLTITVTYYNNSTSASSTTGTRYYNAAGNYVNPSFTLSQASKSGWTARGWSTSNAGNAGITYNNGATFTRDSNITLYGLYYATIYLYTVVKGSTTTNSGTVYWAPAGTTKTSFTVSNPSISGATFQGWSTSASSTSVSYSSINGLSLSANTTLYAVYKYPDASITLSPFYIYMDDPWATPNATSFATIDGTKYSSITANITTCNLECAEWSTGCHAQLSLGTYNGSTLYHSVMLRYIQNVSGVEKENTGYPCQYGNAATVTVNLANATGQTLRVVKSNDVFSYNVIISSGKVSATGRTAVG